MGEFPRRGLYVAYALNAVQNTWQDFENVVDTARSTYQNRIGEIITAYLHDADATPQESPSRQAGDKEP